MRKMILLTAVLLMSQVGFASELEGLLSDLITNHENMVDNSGESYIKLDIFEHSGNPELGEIVAQLSQDYVGLEDLKLERIADPTDSTIFDTLFSYGGTPFFCQTLGDANSWDVEEEECRDKLKVLFGDALSKDVSVYVLDMYGNYYGDWQEVNVIFVNHGQKTGPIRSVILRFDMFHEI